MVEPNKTSFDFSAVPSVTSDASYMGKIDFFLFSDSIDAYFKVIPPIAVLLDKHPTRALGHYSLRCSTVS
jgi:hypothetical protein